MTARSDGFSHDLVLREPPARPLGSLRLPLKLTGLTASVTDAGGIRLADADGTTVYTATQPLMWDARIDPVSGDIIIAARALGGTDHGTGRVGDRGITTRCKVPIHLPERE